MLSFRYLWQFCYKINCRVSFFLRGYAHDPPPKGLSKELVEFLDSVPDYRRTDKGNFVHTLRDILLLELMARLAKCVMRKEIIDFGKRHLAALRKMGILAKGVPSEPTLCRVSKKTDSQAFAEKMHGFTIVQTNCLRHLTQILTPNNENHFSINPIQK